MLHSNAFKKVQQRTSTYHGLSSTIVDYHGPFDQGLTVTDRKGEYNILGLLIQLDKILRRHMFLSSQFN